MINIRRSKILSSGVFENEAWSALHKAWKGYVIAKNKDEYDKMLHYADIIQECQDDLGLEVSSFPDTGKSALAFHSLCAAQIAQENKSNNEYKHNEGQVSEEIDYQYEKERFTADNAYRENFTDDHH